MILDLGIGEGGLFDHRPHHRLFALIQPAVHQEMPELPHDGRLHGRSHGEIGVVPVHHHAHALKLLALHINPPLGKSLAALADFQNREGVARLALGTDLLFYFPLDGQPVAIPSGLIKHPITKEKAAAHHDILQNLVHRMPNMEMPIGIGRPVQQGVRRTRIIVIESIGACLARVIQLDGSPMLQHVGFAFGEVAPHRKARFGQKHRGCRGVGGMVGHGVD